MNKQFVLSFFLCVLFTSPALLSTNFDPAAPHRGSVQSIKNPHEFKTLLANNPLVVAEFYSPQCPHCRNFARAGIFEACATELPNIRFVKVSSGGGTDSGQDAVLDQLHAEYGISAYPTFFVFQNGKKVGKRMGFQHKEPLKHFINDSINK